MKTQDAIRDELVEFTLPDGTRALAVRPSIPDAAPYAIREGIARRRITATTGECPCGAQLDLQAAAEGRFTFAEVVHEPRCPAVTVRLLKQIRRWLR